MSGTRRGRIRPRPVSFGNPALGTYGGCVYTLEEDENGPEISQQVEKWAAMVDVPPEQVPEGFLNLTRSHRPFIKHVRIIVSTSGTAAVAAPEMPRQKARTDKSSQDESSHSFRSMPQEQMSLRPLDDTSSRSKSSHRSGSGGILPSPSALAMESAASILALDKHDDIDLTDSRLRKELLTASDEERPSRTYLILFEFSTQEAADAFVKDLHNVPFTSLDETERCSVFHVVTLQADEGVSLTSPFFAPSASDLGLQHPSSHSTPRMDALEVHNCAVCLEKMELSQESLLTTVCNHSFHLDCLLQWQDSPCPVCRYDHSGLNEALSQCHVCGTTESNYVCLICGVVSCGGGGRSSRRAAAASAANSEDASCGAHQEAEEHAGLSPPLSHARQHYEETLHAYALDTETQHVWDFAGQGYVHRLLQNVKDDKLVEVNDPNSTSQERPLSPGLSDAQEEQVVHRKLEGFASQYYTLLKSQLEQQRIYYEGRLQEIRREYGRPGRRRGSASAELISALKQERNQLTQRCMTLRQRYEKVSDEVAFLRNMNESLEANKAPMKRQIAEAQRQRAETRDMIRQFLPPLEEKVYMLMLQLEESMGNEDDAVERAPSRNDTKPAARKK